MSDIAIRVEGLGKQYRIGGKQEPYRTLRETITDAVAAPFRRANRLLRGQAYGAAGLEETIWALKDVSFEVKRGEVVGIIGRNGAGKSTLLKVLSRITEPTEGYAEVYGRVGSLLEVGTGFHPELTGRENIYLNGAILGMKRAEIDRKFDEIVAFAEVERFIDTPVKHYSSGMYLRLAFAVAAHLDPEILLVDEVLAVGDAQFQKKCLGKMGEVGSEGRTVLLVSHNMAAIGSLCTQAFVFDVGRIVAAEPALRAVQTYAQLTSQSSASSFVGIPRGGKGLVRFTSAHLEDENGNVINQAISGQPLRIILDYFNYSTQQLSILIAITIFAPDGHKLAFLSSYYQAGQDLLLAPGPGRVECILPRVSLSIGRYGTKLWCGPRLARSNIDYFDQVQDAFILEVTEGDYYGTGFGTGFVDNVAGSVFLDHFFQINPDHSDSIYES